MLACAGLQIPKASPPSPAVSWSLNPGGAAAGETPRPGPPRVCAAPRGHLGPGLRVTLSAQQPKGPAGESALSLSGGFLPRGVSSESPSGGFPPRGVSSECPSGGFPPRWATRGGRCVPVSASLLGGGARGGWTQAKLECMPALGLDRRAQGHSSDFHRMSAPVSALCGSIGTPARPASGVRALGIDGDHLPAAAPDQQHPVQPLGQDLEELHICSGAELRTQPAPHKHEGRPQLPPSCIVGTWPEVEEAGTQVLRGGRLGEGNGPCLSTRTPHPGLPRPPLSPWQGLLR